MPPHCYVPGCKSGYASNVEKRHLFKARDCFLESWSKAIGREDLELTNRSYVCDLHFTHDCIVKHFEHIINGEKAVIDRANWKLKDSALPTIFAKLPSGVKKRRRKRCAWNTRSKDGLTYFLRIPSEICSSNETVTEYAVTAIKTESGGFEYSVDVLDDQQEFQEDSSSCCIDSLNQSAPTGRPGGACPVSA